MRRLSDGVKVTDRFKTTEQVERAFVEDKNFDFLYSDADGYHFMNNETYDQIQVPGDVIGDQAQWLQEGMKVMLSIFNDVAVGIQLPQRVTLERSKALPTASTNCGTRLAGMKTLVVTTACGNMLELCGSVILDDK